MSGPLRRGLAAAVLLLVAPAAGLAQSARAYLDQTQVGLNREFVLNVEVSGAQRLDEAPARPDLSSFAAYLGSRTQTAMQIVNGRASTTVTHQYRYQATAEGTFEIGPIELRAAGHALRTEPLTLTVSSAPPGSAAGAGREGGIADEDLFLTATASATEVYVNQPVVLEYRIFTRVDIEGYEVTRQPATAGFWVEALGDSDGRVEQVVRDGRQYASAVIRRVALFPTSAGPRTIEPLAIEAQVRAQGGARSLFDDPFGGVFGGGLFGRRVPVAIGSEPVALDVRPLPAGQPVSFTGLVGRLEVSATIDRTTAETNDALTYRLELSGTGNIRMLPEPELRFPDSLERYPPEVTERIVPDTGGVRGSRTFEYVVVPRTPGPATIPGVALAYLDPDTGSYEIAAADPIALTITGDPVATPGPVGRLRTGVDLQRDDIRFIRMTMPDLRPIGRTLFATVWFWVVVVAPLVALAGAMAARRHDDRLRGDVAYARRRRAARVAKQRLAAADALQTPDRHREFHAEIARALQGFLGDKLNLPEAGLIREEVRPRLLARGVAEELADRYLGCLEDCDRQRFAPISPDQGAMREMLARAGQAMTDLEQTL